VKTVFSEEYRITSYLVNLRQRAGLYGILNLIQDVGWQHAVELGFRFSEEGLAWVFTRQKLRMSRWPGWNESVRLDTWLRPVTKSPFVFRDYELYVGREKVGECTSSFTVIDTKTRKLAQPDWSRFENAWRQGAALALEPGKIPPDPKARDLAEFEVRNSDLDLNDHVNNTKYAQWVLDAVSLDAVKSVDVYEYEINFLAETKKGDLITVQQSPGEAIQFQGLRKADGKIVFTARMGLSP
jgi:acyl-ACP thioesterase